MTKKFVVGPAKLIDGRDAYIFEVSDMIFGKIQFGETWIAAAWTPPGISLNLVKEDRLLPNAAPLQVEFVTFVDQSAKLDSLWSYCYSKELIGKKVKVVVTEILE